MKYIDYYTLKLPLGSVCSTVYNAGSTSNQHWLNVSCLGGGGYLPIYTYLYIIMTYVKAIFANQI